jgi:acyl dehydratase
MTYIGERFEGRVFVASAPSMKVVAALLRDPNPLHFDRSAVSAMGRGPQLVGQGPVSAALLYQSVLDRWAGSTLMSASLRYIANVLEGEEIRALVTVTDVRPRNGGSAVETDVRMVDQDGIVKVTGRVVVLCPKPDLERGPSVEDV